MAYSAIASIEADANSPADATLWGKVKDNFDDHETRIDTMETTLVDSVVGDYYIHKNEPSRSTTSTFYVKLKEIKLDKAGAIRTKFTLVSDTGGGWVYGKVYRNGSAVGTEQSMQSTTPSEYSEDISGWAIGDLYQIYGKTVNGGQVCTISDQKVCVGSPGTTPGAHNDY